MQTQPRRPIWAFLFPSQSEGRPVAEAVPAGPVELDLEALRHVAGGYTTATPKGSW